MNPKTHAAKPVETSQLDWVPLEKGLSFKPLTYFPDNAGWQLLLRLEPGTVIPRHRHTGEVHGFNLSGSRLLLDTQQVIGPGTYVHEPAGNEDTWQAIGDEPCVVHIEVNGRIEYLDAHGAVVRVSDANASRQAYVDWCVQTGREPRPELVGTRG